MRVLFWKNKRKVIAFSILVTLTMVLPPVRQKANSDPGGRRFIINRTLIFPGISFGTTESGEAESVIIPLKRVGNLFLIEARIDNETGNFLFDTGSSQLVLNTTYFRKYITIEGTEASGITGIAGTIRRTAIRKMWVAGLSYNNITADVTELGHIENRRGIKVLGLFGLSMLRGFEMVIDLAHNELRLFRLDKAGNRISRIREEFRADVSQKFREYKNIIFIKASIGGKELTFCLDTGAESNVLNCYASRKVLGTVTILRRSDMMGVGSERSEVLYGSMNDFLLENRSIPGMPVILASLNSLSAAYNYPVDGMLGYDFFAQGKICINLVTKEIKICFHKQGRG